MFRDFPLDTHQQAFKASEAAQCAKEQGKFWEYHDTLFANQGQLMPDDLKRYAAELQLDTQAFGECLDSGRFADEVRADIAAGQAYGVSATPTFFINGRLVSGAASFEQFQQLIDEELERKGAQ